MPQNEAWDIWVDAQLSPALAPWITEAFGINAFSVSRLGLRDAEDREIFLRAKAATAIVITKDSDFVSLLDDLGPPPRILWLTLGNTSNAYLKALLRDRLEPALALFDTETPLVEISDKL